MDKKYSLIFAAGMAAAKVLKGNNFRKCAVRGTAEIIKTHNEIKEYVLNVKEEAQDLVYDETKAAVVED